MASVWTSAPQPPLGIPVRCSVAPLHSTTPGYSRGPHLPLQDNPEVHTVLEMGYGRLQLAAAVCAEGLRPLLPRRCPPGFAELMRACWRADPAERPTFRHVMEALEGLADEVVHWEAEEADVHEVQLHQGPRLPAVGTPVELKIKSQKPHEPPVEGQIVSTNGGIFGICSIWRTAKGRGVDEMSYLCLF